MAKAAYIGVSNVARKVKTPHIGVSGVARKVKSGYVGVNGVARQFLQGGILASTLSVGSSVYLMENGSAVEYLVVNQGIPSGSSLYDSSCDGTWLLRKNIYIQRSWTTNANDNDYGTSTTNSFLNGDFFNSLGSVERSVVKQVKIPHCATIGSMTVSSGSNGLSTYAFLLSGYEVGWTKSDNTAFPIDGAKLSYFETSSGGNSKRIAYFNGSTSNWWLRSPYGGDKNHVWGVSVTGLRTYSKIALTKMGVRPALVLPSNALFDENTLVLKGVV